MSKELTNEMSIVGELEIITRNLETGEVIDSFKDSNVVLTQGKAEILRAMTIYDTNIHRVKTIKIGNDLGNGGVLNPEPATANLTEASQNVLYEVPVEAFSVSYPNVNSVRFSSSLNGMDVMSNYPELPNIIYTSAVIYTFGNKAITYRRFPARTISSLISVDIAWTLTIL